MARRPTRRGRTRRSKHSSPTSRRCSAPCAKSASARTFRSSEELDFAVRCDAATAEAARADAAVLRADGPGDRRPPGARTPTPPDVAASVTLAGQRGPIEVHVDVSRFIDVGAERKRLEKERENLAKQIESIDGKLANTGFVDKAPAEVVQQQRDKLAELREQLASVEAALKKLGVV